MLLTAACRFRGNAHTAFEQFRKVNPRQRAKWLLEWHNLTAAAREDALCFSGEPPQEPEGIVDLAICF
jgi:hypothetical protein